MLSLLGIFKAVDNWFTHKNYTFFQFKRKVGPRAL